jgi:SAM-dependent methyltransferase
LQPSLDVALFSKVRVAFLVLPRWRGNQQPQFSGASGEVPATRTMLCSMPNGPSNTDSLPHTFWERAAEKRWGRYLTSAEKAALETAASSVRLGTSLEIGCDGGRWSGLLAALGWSTICVDVSEEAVELCRSRIPSARCLLTKSEDRSFPVEDTSVNLLLVYEVPPVTNSPWFASEAARVLEPGGTLVCTISNPASIRAAVYRARTLVSASRRRWRTYEGPTFQDVRRDLEAHGFNLLHKEGLGWAPFNRHSDSRLIPYFTWLEQVVGLRRLVRFSPLVIVVARRMSTELPRESRT